MVADEIAGSSQIARAGHILNDQRSIDRCLDILGVRGRREPWQQRRDNRVT